MNLSLSNCIVVIVPLTHLSHYTTIYGGKVTVFTENLKIYFPKFSHKFAFLCTFVKKLKFFC